MSTQRPSLADIFRDLEADWCDSFSVVRIEEALWSVTTPFLMPDGDGYAVLIRQTASGWQLTDGGTTAARSFSDLAMSAAREARFRLAVEMLGLELEDWTATLDLPAVPDATDIAFFVKAVAAAQLAPALEVTTERSDRYSERMRTAIASAIAPGVRIQPDWYPSIDERQLYRSDVYIEIPTNPVLMFTVGNAERAATTALSVERYREWDVPGVPFAIVKPTVGSKSVYRLQDVVGEDNVTLIEATDRFRILRTLRELSVPTKAA